MQIPNEASFLGYAAECEAKEKFFNMVAESVDPMDPEIWHLCAQLSEIELSAFTIEEITSAVRKRL
jgi:hypothetical protein